PSFNNSDWHNEYPVGPNNRYVNHWAADYISFNNPDICYDDLTLVFDGNINIDFGLGIIRSLTSGYFSAYDIFPTDSYWMGDFPDFGDCYYITNMVAGLGGYGTANYSYAAETSTGIGNASLPGKDFSIGPLYPNPFNQSIQIRFSKLNGQDTKIEIFDICGRFVRKWNVPATENSGEILWDGKDFKGENIASGVYLFKISDGTNSRIIKGTLLK
ncbi:MAG: hypothetical protein DRP26_02395, partial [Candidatus Zixiibacteriota bacterium]